MASEQGLLSAVETHLVIDDAIRSLRDGSVEYKIANSMFAGVRAKVAMYRLHLEICRMMGVKPEIPGFLSLPPPTENS